MEQLCTVSTVHTVNRVLISIAHTVLISIVHTKVSIKVESLDASVDSILGDTGCIRLLLNWSRRMHPATIKMESPDASGDSRKIAHHGDCPLTVTKFAQNLFKKVENVC